MQRTSQGKLRLLSAHDRRIYEFNHTTDIGLRPVGRTRPGLPRLLSACPPPFGAGHTCSSTHAFASGFLRASLAAQHPCLWLPFASVRLGLDFDRHLCYNTDHHHLAARPSLAHPRTSHRLSKRNRRDGAEYEACDRGPRRHILLFDTSRRPRERNEVRILTVTADSW